MKTANLTDLQQAVAEWKKLNIVKCDMEFSCGGDSMNDYHFTFYDKDNKEVDSDLLDGYFDNEVYNEVEFYVNSDGHYQGESGYVYITFEEDEDNENGAGGYFSYDKQAESEWNETYTEVGFCELTPEEVIFIKQKIQSIVGGQDGEAVNYKGDCILTNEDEELLQSVVDKIQDYAEGYQFKEAEGEANDWFTYTTDLTEANSDYEGEVDEDNPTTITDGKVGVVVSQSFTIYKQD